MKLHLNLLPPQKKAGLRAAVILAYVQSVVFLVLLAAGFVAFFLLSMRLLLNANLRDLSRNDAAPDTVEFQVYTDEIKAMNGHATRLAAVAKGRNDWSWALTALDAALPDGVTVSRVELRPDGRVAVSGTGKTRDAVLAFQRNLTANPIFRDLQSPLANILQRTNVKFDISVVYAEFRAPPSLTPPPPAEKTGAKKEEE